jgi:biopolymer transport protein ExbD/biopolymer transport protein TolR
VGVELQVGGKKKRVTPSMNVTPLVDVVLVLLIIFMVITPMMTKHFWLHHPKKTTVTTPEDQLDPDEVPIVVSVRADQTIWVNNDQVTLETLNDKVARVLASRPVDEVVFFDADDRVPYGDAVTVLDHARGGGAVHIAVLTEAVQR